MPDAKDLIYKSTVKQTYGLSDGWIARIGEPDKIVQNPHYRSGMQAYLYSRARVEAFIEAHQEEYDAYQVKRAKRSARMSAVAQEKREKLLQWARAAQITVEPLSVSWKKLLEVVLFNGYQWHDDFTLSPNAVLAHVRHNQTNYHELLAQIESQTGCNEAYPIIRERVDKAARKALEARFKEWAAYLKGEA
jgi:hypothetical protein